MSDFTEELTQKLNSAFKEKVDNNEALVELVKVIQKSSDYSDAYEFAVRYGEALAECIEELGIEEWYFGTAMETLAPSLEQMDIDVSTVCEAIQINKNTESKQGIKPQKPKYSEQDTRDTIDKIVEDPGTLVDEVATYAERVVDRYQKANADFAMNSGLKIRVTRIYDGVGLRRGTKSAKECTWCADRAGVWEFETTTEAAESGVFSRHAGCKCSVDYERIRA